MTHQRDIHQVSDTEGVTLERSPKAFLVVVKADIALAVWRSSIEPWRGASRVAPRLGRAPRVPLPPPIRFLLVHWKSVRLPGSDKSCAPRGVSFSPGRTQLVLQEFHDHFPTREPPPPDQMIILSKPWP